MEKQRFLGTAAWFFLGVNLSKLPFSIGLGLVHRDMLVTAAVLAPMVLAGGVVGVFAVRRIEQRSFDTAVLLASLISALSLLLGTM